MAKCGGCGEATTRIKIILTDDRGNMLAQPIEYCRLCRPEEFQRWQDPSNKKSGWAWQYDPAKYNKRYMEDGAVFYEGTDETRADLESQLAAKTEDDLKYERAKEKKRQERRTEPLTPSEIERAANRIRAQRQTIQ